MGNNSSLPFEPKDSCGVYNVTVAFIADKEFFNITGIRLITDNAFYPINTFSFFNAFILFCLQGLIFKPVSSFIKHRSSWYKETFYSRDKRYNDTNMAHMHEDSLQPANSQPFLHADSEADNGQQPLPFWARFLQNNVMSFCDPLFVIYHTLFHVAHYAFLLWRVLTCEDDGSGYNTSCHFTGKPWLLYESFYIRVALSGSPVFFSLFLMSCFVHEGGVLVGFNLKVFHKHKLHGVCLLINSLLLLPAIITHSIPMAIVYSPFIIALCLCLSAAVVSLTWLLNYFWDNVSCCSRACDGRAILLIMQIIMKVTLFGP